MCKKSPALSAGDGTFPRISCPALSARGLGRDTTLWTCWWSGAWSRHSPFLPISLCKGFLASGHPPAEAASQQHKAVLLLEKQPQQRKPPLLSTCQMFVLKCSLPFLCCFLRPLTPRTPDPSGPILEYGKPTGSAHVLYLMEHLDLSH